ncbi:unnamed protein product [Prunus armeniaca]
MARGAWVGEKGVWGLGFCARGRKNQREGAMGLDGEGKQRRNQCGWGGGGGGGGIGFWVLCREGWVAGRGPTAFRVLHRERGGLWIAGWGVKRWVSGGEEGME